MSAPDRDDELERRTVVGVVIDPDGSLVDELDEAVVGLGGRTPAAQTSVDEVLALVRDSEVDVLLVARVGAGTLPAVRRLLDHARDLDPSATTALVRAYEQPTIAEALAASLAAHRRERRRTRRRPPGTLTKREAQVLRLAARGASNGEIAHALWLSPETVKFHLANTYRKLGVGGRHEAVRAAAARGLFHAGMPEVEPGDGVVRA